jgi:hypothetical protein
MMDQSEYGAQPYPASGAAWIRKNAISGLFLTKTPRRQNRPAPPVRIIREQISMIYFKSRAFPLSCVMQDPISNNELEAGTPDASRHARESIEHTGKKILNYRPPANTWVPLAIGGTAALIVVGYYLGRQYQADTRSGAEKFLRELQAWVEEHSASVPASLRERLNATSSFLGNSLRRTPLERLVSQFRSKPRRFWDIFS